MNRIALVTAALVTSLALTLAGPSSAATKNDDARVAWLEARAHGVLREPKAGSRMAAPKADEARTDRPSRDERVDATAARSDARAARGGLR